MTELKRMFQYLNKIFFNGKLEKVDFVVNCKKKVGIKFNAELNSIIIGEEFLKIESSNILSILLHEMIHICNYQNCNEDVTINQYHNKNFLDLALKVGFYVIKHKNQGWSITTTTFPRNVINKVYIKQPEKSKIKLTEIFNEAKLDKSIIVKLKEEIRQKSRQEKPIKTYFLKYQCHCAEPHNSIRSGRRPDGPNALNIQCQNCGAFFECVSELD